MAINQNGQPIGGTDTVTPSSTTGVTGSSAGHTHTIAAGATGVTTQGTAPAVTDPAHDHGGVTGTPSAAVLVGSNTHAHTSAAHTHGITGPSGSTAPTVTDPAHNHTQDAHSHAATGLTATDAGHTHTLPATTGIPSNSTNVAGAAHRHSAATILGSTASTTATVNAITAAGFVRYEAPITADTTTIVATLDPIADGALTIAAQPDYPRKLQVNIVDANNSVTGDLALVGVGASGQAVTQTIALTGGSRTVTTTNAYATLTSATLSGVAGAAAGDTISIGPAEALGLPGTQSPAAGTFAVHKSTLNNANEAIGTVDATAGTIVPTSVPDGARNYSFWYSYQYTPTQTAHTHAATGLTNDQMGLPDAVETVPVDGHTHTITGPTGSTVTAITMGGSTAATLATNQAAATGLTVDGHTHTLPAATDSTTPGVTGAPNDTTLVASNAHTHAIPAGATGLTVDSHTHAVTDPGHAHGGATGSTAAVVAIADPGHTHVVP